ncbi:MAG: hypothetical protein QOH15_3223, partial [Gaiellales bacterium]|nr:hypothetical protein [Gaiellales bacterium]
MSRRTPVPDACSVYRRARRGPLALGAVLRRERRYARRMELATVRFPTDSEDADRLAAVARQAAEHPSIRQAEVVEGFGNGLDIKVVLERPEDEREA